MMDKKYLAEIKAREQAATQGPWMVGDGSIELFFQGQNAVVSESRVIAERATYNDLNRDKHTFADIAFIAHARTDIPALLAEVERLTDIEKEYLHYRRLSEKLDQQIAMLKKELEIAGKTLEIQFPSTKAENWVDMWEQQAQEQEAKDG